ncbi:MAG: hypothetical protein LBG77_06095 [Dysgonamonadaceae bacterium]|jgi:hypothetical protein|nr:hypothetical protein [Dysgonamonadaceae bacterium]
MATGITIERTYTGIPTFARINLRKHPDFIPLLEEKGIQIEKKKVSKNPAITGVLPRGYVTLEQFEEDTINIINDYCRTHDIH